MISMRRQHKMTDPPSQFQLALTSTPASATEIRKAQRFVGAAMFGCMGLWFAPFVGGLASSAVESALISKVLKIMGCYSKASSNRIYWFYRQKTLFLVGGTFIPFLGVALQLFETYGIGQFAIHCALKPELLTDDTWLEQSWQEIAPDIFSGEHAIQSYQQFTGKPFPDYARAKFIATVDFINQLYLHSQQIPGAAETQESLAKIGEQAMRLGMQGVSATAGHIATAAQFAHKQATSAVAHADHGISHIFDKSTALRQKMETNLAARKVARRARSTRKLADKNG